MAPVFDKQEDSTVKSAAAEWMSKNTSSDDEVK